MEVKEEQRGGVELHKDQLDQELKIPPVLLGRGSKEITARALDQSNVYCIISKIFVLCIYRYIFDNWLHLVLYASPHSP